MSTTENIMVSVIVVVIFMVLAISIYSKTTDYVITEYNLEKQEHLHDLYSNDINAILQVTENTSKRPIANLLANSLHYRNELLNYSEGTINITKTLKDKLDFVYGKKRYYLTIKPQLIDISLNFVIDGSDSLNDERNQLGNELPNLLEKLKQKINKTGDEQILAQIYILGNPNRLEDQKKCNSFDTTRPDTLCKIIGAKELYLQKNTTNTSTKYNSFDNESYKRDYNITPPYKNLTKIREIRKEGEKDYYEADWGSGISYASAHANNNAKLVIIFPMSDELSTSSISQECFNIKNNQEQKICDLCTKSCSETTQTTTELRSLKTIQKSIEIAKDNSHIINPIFAYNCDYNYKTIFNSYYEIIEGTQTTNCCKEESCEGCSHDGNGVCFHSECKNTIIEQMQHLAAETNGELIDLKDIEKLIYSVHGSVDTNIDKYKIEIGSIKNNTQKHVIKRLLPLPNKVMADMELVVYPTNEVI